MAGQLSRIAFRPALLLATVLLLVALAAPRVAAQAGSRPTPPDVPACTSPFAQAGDFIPAVCKALTTATAVDIVSDDLTVCHERTVEIAIRNVASLYGYQFEVAYDQTLMSAVAAFDHTWFDPAMTGFDGPAGWQAACDDVLGICRFAHTRGYPAEPISGSGVVATITFTSRKPTAPSGAAVSVQDVVLSDRDGYQILPVSAGTTTLGVCGAAPVGFCPSPHSDVGRWRTDLLGTGQVGRTRKLMIPNWEQVESLTGQLAAIDRGIMKYVRFRYPDNQWVQVTSPTSPAFRPYAVSWWGADLVPSKNIRSQFFWGLKGNQSPRAFVLWPRYATPETYADVLTLFDDSAANFVYWKTAAGWSSVATASVAVPQTIRAGADILVQVAIVDNDHDRRPVVLRVTSRAAGIAGVSQEIVRLGPNARKTLNVEKITLSDVPAGTDEVVVSLYSPGPFDLAYGTGADGGDSAAMIGAAVSYACLTP